MANEKYKNLTIEQHDKFLEEEAEEEFIQLMEWEKDFTLNKIPRNEDGSPLFTEDTAENFEKYLDWLADYLYDVEIKNLTLKELAKSKLKSYKTISHKMLILGFDASMYDGEIPSDSIDYIYISLKFDEPFDEFYKKAEKEFLQKHYFNLADNIGVNYADIPWRTPIATLLQKVQDKSERIELLKAFFSEYNYVSSK